MQTTRKFPRTLEEAFGPYQRHGLAEEYDQMPMADVIVVAVCGIAAAAHQPRGLPASRRPVGHRARAGGFGSTGQ